MAMDRLLSGIGARISYDRVSIACGLPTPTRQSFAVDIARLLDTSRNREADKRLGNFNLTLDDDRCI